MMDKLSGVVAWLAHSPSGAEPVDPADLAFTTMISALVLAHLGGPARESAEQLVSAAIAAGWLITVEAGRVQLTSPHAAVVTFGIEATGSRAPRWAGVPDQVESDEVGR